MTKVWLIAVREFAATVFTKGFILGLLIMPAIGALIAVAMPRLMADRQFTVAGEVAVIDPTGAVLPELRSAQAGRRPLTGIVDTVARARGGNTEELVAAALGTGIELTLVERRTDADVETEKAWLTSSGGGAKPLALVVVHANAVTPAASGRELGTYDLYVPARQDDRVEANVQALLREAIISARASARRLDRDELRSINTVPRVRSVTVGAEGERNTVMGLNFIIPIAFMSLLIIGVMAAGQGMLTSTVEEKSNRVVEVLLSAVSPLQLMGGKLLGHMGISLLAMSLYLGAGLVALASFSLFGLLDLTLIVYLLIFFLIAFLTIGSLMMAVGAAVNDMREAQTLMMPLMLVMIAPWLLWMPVVRDPNSTLALVVSFLPPINSFGMLLRLASATPPPAWQVWLSIAIGVAGVLGAVWVSAKVFRIGLLMFGKPPDLRTLIRWVRAA